MLELRTKAGVGGLNGQGIVQPVMIFCLRMSWGLLRAAEQSNTTETRVPGFRVDVFSRLAVWVSKEWLLMNEGFAGLFPELIWPIS